MKSPITNAWESGADRPKLDVERAFLYLPEVQWTYAHHPFLAFFDGRYHAMWSNGREDEDAPGQRILTSSSADFRSWTEPGPLVDVVSGEHGELVLTAGGFHQHAGMLTGYVGRYEYLPEVLEDGRRPVRAVGHTGTGLWALTTQDGATWAEPVDLGLPVVPNYGPEPTASGRLIISGNIAYPHTDDPDGLSGWTMAGIYPADMAGELFDDPQGFHVVRDRLGLPVGLCEGSFYQTDDGVLHMLLRSGTERLWVTESSDNGATWSAPAETEFSNNVSKFHCGRLPDGRFYCVGNPDPEPRGVRNPLVISLSEDGVRFDRHYVLADEHYDRKRPGMHKGGDYGYPHTLIHDGRLAVIVSRQKEAVEVLRVGLDALK